MPCSLSPRLISLRLSASQLLSLFANEHPDVLATIMINCVKMVETTIEYHNNRVSMYVPKNVTNLTIENYELATSICVPADTLMREMRALFSGAKSLSPHPPTTHHHHHPPTTTHPSIHPSTHLPTQDHT